MAKIQNDGTMSLCTVVGLNPIVFQDPATGEFTGTNVDIAKEVAARLGIDDIEWVNIEFASLIPAVQAEQCDAVLGDLVARVDRAKAEGVQFTFPYELYFSKFVVADDSPIQTIEDLRGKKLAGVVSSTDTDTAKILAENLGGGTTVDEFNDVNAGFLALSNGTVDAFIADPASNAVAIEQYPNLREIPEAVKFEAAGQFANEYDENPYWLGAVAYLTRRADGDLNKALSVALHDMNQDGTIQEILENWDVYDPARLEFVRPDN